MKSNWIIQHETWEQTPDRIRRKIDRDTSDADVQSEMELLKK